MGQTEPTLESIEDYGNGASRQKRLTVWIVILSGLLIGAIYGMIGMASSVDDAQPVHTGIMKY